MKWKCALEVKFLNLKKIEFPIMVREDCRLRVLGNMIKMGYKGEKSVTHILFRSVDVLVASIDQNENIKVRSFHPTVAFINCRSSLVLADESHSVG